MNIKEYLLQCITEESAEVIQAIGKVQRFGEHDRFPNILSPTSIDRLVQELNDLEGAVREAVRRGVIPKDWFDPKKVAEKQAKIRRYMKYSRQKRRLHG